MLDSDITDNDTFDLLNVPNARAERFYLLPKIHKRDIPGRPICSTNNHPTENINRFVEHHICKYVADDLHSYVQDTQHFVKQVKQLDKMP